MNVVYLFRQAFEFFNMGFASAMAWLLFVIIMIVTAIQFVVSRRFVFYQGDSQSERGRAGEPAHRRRRHDDAACAARLARRALLRGGPEGRRFGRLKSAPFVILLTGISVLALYPFVWLISASLKPQGDVFDNKLDPGRMAVELHGRPDTGPGRREAVRAARPARAALGLEQRLDRVARRRRWSRSRARSSRSRSRTSASPAATSSSR